MAGLVVEVKSNTKANKFRVEGNASYCKNNFFEALIYYNKSLCFAETFEVKSLAYANRSSVYFETKKYQHCLDDIQLAREHGCPQPRYLDEREVKCRDLMKDQTDPRDDPWNFFKLSYTANKKLPFIVDCLELKEDPKYGKLISTNRDLKPGDIVLIEDPWFKNVDLSHCYDCCSNCMKENMLSLIPCKGKCVNTMFCSAKCAKSASFRHHQFECGLPMPEEINTKLLIDSVNIAGGMKQLHTYMKAKDKMTIFDIDMSTLEDPKVEKQLLMAFLNLNLLPKEWKEHNAMPFREIAKDFWKKPGKKTSKFWNTLKELELFLETSNRVELLGRNKSLNFKHFIDSSKKVKFGSSVSLCSALFNHSCDPNIGWCNVENKGVAVVRYPIKAGEQLFLCYQSFFHEKQRGARRKILFESCQFFCECNACINDYKPLNAMPVVDKNFKNPREVTQLSPSELFNDFKKNCHYIQKNFKNHPCRETVLLTLHNQKILDRISGFGSFIVSLELSAKK